MQTNSDKSTRYDELKNKEKEAEAKKEAAAKDAEYLEKKKVEIDNNLQSNRKQLEEMLKNNNKLQLLLPAFMPLFLNPATVEFVLPLIVANAGMMTWRAIQLGIIEETNRRAELQREENQKEQLKTNEEFNKLQDELNKINLEKVSYKEATEILNNGIKLIAETLDSWRKLHKFFALNKLEIERRISRPIGDFKQEMSLDVEIRLLLTDSIDNNIQLIKSNSHMFGLLAKTYVEISEQHIMPALSGLNRYSAVDPSEKEKILKQFIASTNAAQTAIQNYLEQRIAIE